MDEGKSTSEEFFVEENSVYRFSLILQNEQMECLAQIEVFPASNNTEDENNVAEEEKASTTSEQLNKILEVPAPIISPPDIFWFMHQNNIIQTIDYSAVYGFCAAIEMEGNVEPTVVARGIEPIKGADGWFELIVKITGEEAAFEEDEDGNVDLRNLHAYTEIEVNQKLGTVHPPQDGIDGMDVCGRAVMGAKGEPFTLLGGEGVELKFDDRVAFATKAGRALFEKKTISVVDQLFVSGNVDLTIGNIDFNGFVEVTGDVPDDFDIKATKGVKVGGVIGACHIESAGSVEIASMSGKEIGHIICHGDLHATYLNQVMVQCFGDVYISNEIRNSIIKSTGKIVVERGAIIGGSCISLDGIEAKSLGTTSGLKTDVVAGVYFPDLDRFDYLRSRLLVINRQIDSILTAMKPLQRNLENEELKSIAAKRMEILVDKLRTIEAEKDMFSAEISASTPQVFSNNNPKINVFDKLMDGVNITLGGTTEAIRIARSGPLSIIENSRDSGLYFLTLTPIQVMAVQLEEEIIAAENELARGAMLDKQH